MFTRADRTGPDVFLWPPFVAASSVAAGSLVDLLDQNQNGGFASTFFGVIDVKARVALAVIWVTLGVYLARRFKVTLQETGQDVKPWKDVPVLVTSGIFAFSRNPGYLGVQLIEFAFCFATDSTWSLIFCALAFVWFNTNVIRQEEIYLENVFKKPYEMYVEHVPRWVDFGTAVFFVAVNLILITLVKQ